MVYFVLIVGICSLLSFLVIRTNKGGFYPLVLKTITSFCFLGLGLLGLVNGSLPITSCSLFIAGGICGLIGDIVLDLKITYPEDSEKYLLLGMSSFTLCHIFYISATMYVFGTNMWYIFGGVIVGVAFYLSTFVMKIKLKKANVNSVLYALVLNISVFQALFLLVEYKDAFSALLFTGAVLFLISDGILMLTYFKGKDSRLYLISNHLIYYLAQFLIMGSLLF